MRVLSTSIVLALLAGACGHDAPEINVGADPFFGTGSTSQPDGGGGSDGGSKPDPTCPADEDGAGSGSAIIVSEVGFSSPRFLELYNRSSTTLSLDQISFGGSISGLSLAAQTLKSGKHVLANVNVSGSQGELAVYQGTTMVQYVCWGQPSQSVTSLQIEAVNRGLWLQSSVCVATDSTTPAIHLRGTGIVASDYVAGAATPLGCTR
jgi:hypothetical protein